MTKDLETIWTAVLTDLKLQMTRATFNTWFSQSTLIEYSNDALTISVHNQQAVEWLEAQLLPTIIRTASVHTESTITAISFVVAATLDQIPDTDVALDAPPYLPVPLPFLGFEPYSSNFTQMPKQFFEIIVPAGPPVVTAFVATVINETIGTFVNIHTGERREWWSASYPEISAASGVKGRASISKAILRSRQLGYVIRQPSETRMKYRIRRLGEPVDNF